MNPLRHLVAACAGYLAQALLVFAAGVSAARATPSGYFAYFGREHLATALGVWSVGTFALPQFLIAALLAWLALRVLGCRPAIVVAFVTGALLCWLRYMAYEPTPEGTLQLVTINQFFATLRAVYFSNLLELLSSWSSWLGLAAGIWLAQRSARATPPRSRAPA